MCLPLHSLKLSLFHGRSHEVTRLWNPRKIRSKNAKWKSKLQKSAFSFSFFEVLKYDSGPFDWGLAYARCITLHQYTIFQALGSGQNLSGDCPTHCRNRYPRLPIWVTFLGTEDGIWVFLTGNKLGTDWKQIGNGLKTNWKRIGNKLETDWKQSGNGLETDWKQIVKQIGEQIGKQIDVKTILSITTISN